MTTPSATSDDTSKVVELKASADTSPQAVVERFFQACSDFDFNTALDLIDDECVYQNMPFHKAVGKKRIKRDLFDNMDRAMNLFDVEMINISATDRVVMTERIDTLGGKYFEAALPLMGVLVVEDGKITEWRDYFDWTSSAGKFLGSLITSPFRRLRNK